MADGESQGAGFVTKLAASLGASEPAIRLLLSILIGNRLMCLIQIVTLLFISNAER